MSDPKLYSLEFMLPFARKALKASSTFNSEQFAENLFSCLHKANVAGVVSSALTGNIRLKYDYSELKVPIELRQGVSEIIWYLVHRGFILPKWRSFPGDLMGMDFWRTERGTNWANGAEPMPEDVSTYMSYLTTLVPTLDPVISQYIMQGLGSFAREMYFSAAVMLGAASEKEIYLLGGSLSSALRSPEDQKKLKYLLDGRSLYKLLSFIAAKLKCPSSVFRSVFDGAEIHLASIFESVRVQRNDAVHPNTATVSEDSVRMSFEAFPKALEKAETLRRWCDANPNSL